MLKEQLATSYADSIDAFAEKLDCSCENDWPNILDGLLGGLAHHIGNRVAVLSGVADILSQEESIPSILRALVAEVPKLEEGARLLRLLVRENAELEEAMELWRVVDDAALIAAMHPDMRREIVVERSDVAPVYGRRNLLLRDLVGMLIRVGLQENQSAVDRVSARGAQLTHFSIEVSAQPIVVRFTDFGENVLICVGDEKLWVQALR